MNTRNVIIIFIITIFFCYSSYQLYITSYEGSAILDLHFHEEIIERIKNQEDLNSEINVLNYTYPKENVETYPKLYHFIVSIIPYNNFKAMGIINSILINFSILLLCGISYLLLKNELYGIIYFMIWKLISIYKFPYDYVNYYLFGLSSQLILQIGILFFIFIGIYLYQKRKEILFILIPFMLFTIPFLHRVPTVEQIIGLRIRLFPIGFLLIIPAFHYISYRIYNFINTNKL